MVKARPLVIVLQTPTVSAGQRGYEATRPIPSRFVIESVYLDSSLASPLVLANVGISYGDVTTQASAALGTPIVDHFGQTATTGVRQAIPLPNGAIAVAGLNVASNLQHMRIFLEVINGHATTSAQVSALIQGYYHDEQDQDEPESPAPSTPINPATSTARRVQQNTPVPPA